MYTLSLHSGLQGELLKRRLSQGYSHGRQPVLLLALDDYFSAPSQDCLARLFDAINSMELAAAPTLTRAEKLIMRTSERKDVFAEKFMQARPPTENLNTGGPSNAARGSHRTTPSESSHSSFEEGILLRTKDGKEVARERPSTDGNTTARPLGQYLPSENSFSLGGSAVWVGDESGLLEQTSLASGSNGSSSATTRGRRSTDASSTSSHGQHAHGYGSALPMHSGGSDPDPHLRPSFTKDTHFYSTIIDYGGHQLPIKMPLSTFPEEVGDVS